MTKFISLEFLVAVLFIIDFFVIFLLFLFVKRVNRIPGISADQITQSIEAINGAAENAADTAANQAAGDVRDVLMPLVQASQDAAREFETLIREKKKITRALNDALDAKIISLNLLLSRADTLEKKMEIRAAQPMLSCGAPSISQTPVPSTVLDQQNRIIELYFQQVDIDTIAEQLSIPKGEVQLVIDLKEKFIAMENT